MAEVFRLHDSTKKEDWFTSAAYGQMEIDGISDNAGVKPNLPITSIPSPFARIDLFKTALKQVATSHVWEGDTIYHKLVSDCLDMMELVFDMGTHGIQIDVWDKTNDLSELINSPYSEHQLYGSTLSLFLLQDSAAYNFDKMNKIFIIKYNHKVIGGTSPVTMFFTTPTEQNLPNITIGNRRTFSKLAPKSNYPSLLKRDRSFQEYLYSIFEQNQPLKVSMPDLFKYVDTIFRSDSTLWAYLNGINTQSILDDLSDINLPGGVTADVLNVPIKTRKFNPIDDILKKSDFVIQPTKAVKKDELMPLVLVDKFKKKLFYVAGTWDQNTKVPYRDATPIQQRTLPGDGKQYPYITIGDFLEDYLIKLIYPINTSCFYSYSDKNLSFDYLLPLKKDFFDFFDISDLQKVTRDNKPYFEMKTNTSGMVTVTLRIPIKNGNFIEYTKNYYPQSSEEKVKQIDPQLNEGEIIEYRFGLTLFPPLKVNIPNFPIHYRVMIVDADDRTLMANANLSLEFYSNSSNTKVDYTDKKIRTKNKPGQTYYYILEQNFDYIKVTLSPWMISGILVPKFKQYTGGPDQYTFSIDFGTSNTHIEYRINDNTKAKAFDITDDDQQLGTLRLIDNQEIQDGQEIIDNRRKEFLPDYINSSRTDLKYPQGSLPIRTVIAEDKAIIVGNVNYCLADYNIPFMYELEDFQNSSYHANLKWTNFTGNSTAKTRVEMFFEEILFLIRNKVLINNGNLNNIKIVWFYPSSMSKAQINFLQNTWKILSEKYFSDGIILLNTSESIAPFYYFNKEKGVASTGNRVVSIDIGGGTTDIVVYYNDNPEFTTSFQFASNAIFGDGFSLTADSNGFVQGFKDTVLNALGSNNQFSLQDMLDKRIDAGDSNEVISLFFALEKNSGTSAFIKFSEYLLHHDKLKIIFLLFYSSIIYHIATIMKVKNLGVPRFITFSGMGSKAINLITPDFATLQEYTKHIFNKIFQEIVYSKNKLLEIKQEEKKPKEVTCKGGTLMKVSLFQSIDTEKLNIVLLGDDKNTISGEKEERQIFYRDIENDTQLREGVIKNVEHFFDVFYEIHKNDFNYNTKLGINNSVLDKRLLTDDISMNLNTGIKNKLQDASKRDQKVEETLFFYPLIGLLNSLAYKIYKQ